MKASTDKKSNLMEGLLEKAGFAIPKRGDVVEAKIIEAKSHMIFLDLENFKTGVIMGGEIRKNPRAFKNANVGEVLTVKIINLENEDGYVEVSLLKAGEEKKWQTVKDKKESGEIAEGKVVKANKGGIMVEIGGVEAFMPVSQLSSSHYPRVEGGDKQKILQALSKLVGETIKFKVLDLDQKENKLIISEKAAEENKIKQILDKYQVGDIVDGEITGIVNFGAFVKFDDLEGLIHISEIDWQIIDNPYEFFKVGDKVKAKIVEIEGDRVSLSTKALKENPWEKVRDKYDTGQIVKGTVTKINPFGAFVKLDPHIQGLAHISEFGNEAAMKETLEIGKKYEFKILSIKPSEYRMALKLAETETEKKEKPEKEKKEKAEKAEKDEKKTAIEEKGKKKTEKEK